MDISIKEKFIQLSEKYLGRTELPITFYYTNDKDRAKLVKPGRAYSCVVEAFAKVRQGSSFYYDVDNVVCGWGKKYLGFTAEDVPGLEYLLSCGHPDVLNGHGVRYKKSPEVAKEYMNHRTSFKAPGRFIVFKRWDMLEYADTPEVVVFFSQPDVLAALVVLANFDETAPCEAFVPEASGCSCIVQYPYLESLSDRPRGVIGMLFDVGKRQLLKKEELAFSIPINKFLRMIEYMEESFLITDDWKRIQRRIS